MFSAVTCCAITRSQPVDFFDQQERARKQTKLLIWLFGLAVVAVIVLTYLILATCILAFIKPLPHETRIYPIFITFFMLLGEAVLHPLDFLAWLWDARLVCWISLVTLTFIALGCYFKIRQLSDGGAVVAELLGGRGVEPKPADADEQRLRNVVEEMAVASGTSVPEIYVLDNERGINAFAAGHTRNDVAIGITRGCLRLPSRDELQGVIAHEFSHILNGDTWLNMRLMGLAHGLIWPTILGRALIYGSAPVTDSSQPIWNDDDQNTMLPTAPLGFFLVFIGSISLPFVRTLKSAICREREWLADAAAVQFTRNPVGIAGAFKKIGGLSKRGRLDTPYAEMASHLYFVNSTYSPWFNFLATHPPLKKRILAIDTTFDGQFPKVQMLAPNQYERDQAYEQTLANAVALEGRCSEDIAGAVGTLTADRIRATAAMRLNVPPDVMQALREPIGAIAIIYDLLLNGNDSIRAAQLKILESESTPELFQKTTKLADQIQELRATHRFAMAQFAVPALRQLSADRYNAFAQTTQQLIQCDGAIELFEYALLQMVHRQLRAYFEGPDQGKMRFGRVKDVLPECTLLLSALAHVGQENETEARAAFAKGRDLLDAPGCQIQFLSRSEWDLAKVDAALTRLAKCPRFVQRNILAACGRTVTTDGRVNEREAELLRAIADAMDCPVPPSVEAMWNEEMTAQS